MNYPDCDVINAFGGSRLIPSRRDLEDYTRLWMAGLRKAYQANTNLVFKLERACPLPDVHLPLVFPANRLAIFACGAESWSKAPGATSVGGVFVSDTGSRNELDLQAMLGFGNTHRFHSGQFRSSMSERVGYWNQFLIVSGLKDPE